MSSAHVNLDDKNKYWSVNFKNKDFSGLEISAKEFDGCTFEHCDFSESTFKRCNFVDCEFINCNLSIVNIDYCKFSDVVFRDSKLIGINWTQVAWPSVIFNAPFAFYKCILNDSSFYGLALQGLIIEECKAHHVDFRQADLSNANLSYSDFTGCVFNKTDLTAADFSEATHYAIDIFNNKLKNAKFSRFEAVRLLDSLDIELVD